MPSGKRHVLLLGKPGDPHLLLIAGWLSPAFTLTMLTEPMVKPVPCDVLVSYRYSTVVPGPWLPELAINFHPGPPERPGIGSTDWALHEGALHFGVTAHHMATVPDTGPIIAVRRFPIRPHDTLLTLTQRAHAHMLSLADEVLTYVLLGEALPWADDWWSGKPKTRKDLEALKELWIAK